MQRLVSAGALLGLAAASLWASGCKDSTGAPRIDRVEPASGPAGQPVPMRILGEGFAPAIRGNFDDSAKSTVSSGFSALIGGRGLSELTYISPGELRATVPPDLPEGSHDLQLTGPRGRTTSLTAAYTVLGGDAGPLDSGADGPAPDGPVPDGPAPDTLAPDTLAPDTLAPDTVPTGTQTLAGTGTPAFVDGPAAQASFNAPRGLAVLGDVVFVADFNNHRVRKIEAGQVTTVAGSGTQGYVDGPAASAQLNLPDSLAADQASGALYVADSANSCVRKIEGGQVTTFAGANSGGMVDGPSADARFATPRGLAISADGAQLYVADAGNHRIRLIVGGTVTTLAGSTEGFADGPAASARFSNPGGLWVEGSRVYVADTGNQRLRVIEGGQVSTVAGTGDKGQGEGPAASATFWNPSGVAVIDDAGGERVYVVDQANHAIRLLDASGIVSTINGPGFGLRDGPTATALFFYPRGIAVGAGGVLYIADQTNHRIRAIYP